MNVIALSEKELSDLIDRAALATADKLRQDIAVKSSPEIMTKAECAEYLRCDVSKINRLMVRPVLPIPFLQFGSTPRFRKSEIDRWLEDERIQTVQRQAN